MMLSPHEQHVITPWLKTFPRKFVQRISVWAWPVTMFTYTYWVIASSDAQDYQEEFQHRF